MNIQPGAAKENADETLEDPDKGQTIKVKNEPKPGQKIIRDNQTGVSYKNLFEHYFHGATEINIKDPYIRLPYQLRNLKELAKLVMPLLFPALKLLHPHSVGNDLRHDSLHLFA